MGRSKKDQMEIVEAIASIYRQRNFYSFTSFFNSSNILYIFCTVGVLISFSLSRFDEIVGISSKNNIYFNKIVFNVFIIIFDINYISFHQTVLFRTIKYLNTFIKDFH